MWNRVKDDDEEEQAEDAVDEDVGRRFYANPLPGMRHRTRWARWAMCLHKTQRSACKEGPRTRAKMEGGGGSPERGNMA